MPGLFVAPNPPENPVDVVALLLAPPNNDEPVPAPAVLVCPKVLLPKRPPEPPKPEEVVAVLLPKPPKPDVEPACWLLFEPKSPPPVAVGVEPKVVGFAAPKALLFVAVLLFDPNAPMSYVSRRKSGSSNRC